MVSSQKDKEKPAKEKEIEKESKSTPITIQEQPSTINPGPVNPDWSGFQAYSPVPPHGFLASSPQAHPYMWGIQPVMPPYGTPPHPYVAMYPHGGIYPHPSMPAGSYPFSPFPVPSSNGIVEASGNTPGCLDGDGEPSAVKEKLPIKRLRGSLGSLNMITGKNNGLGKVYSPSANGTCSKSATSASEGTSEGSGGNSENDLDIQLKSGSGQDSLEGKANQNGGSNTPHSKVNRSKAILPTPPVVPSPTTNLNIGMDYWVSPTSSALRGKAPPTPVPGGMITGSRDGAQSQLWPQDERELKRQRRKQSNRESARRSRLRKQAECDELAIRAEAMREENASLTSKVNRMRSEYEQLLLENSSLKERLEENPGNEDSRSGPKDNKKEQ